MIVFVVVIGGVRFVMVGRGMCASSVNLDHGLMAKFIGLMDTQMLPGGVIDLVCPERLVQAFRATEPNTQLSRSLLGTYPPCGARQT